VLRELSPLSKKKPEKTVGRGSTRGERALPDSVLGRRKKSLKEDPRMGGIRGDSEDIVYPYENMKGSGTYFRERRKLLSKGKGAGAQVDPYFEEFF